MTTRVFIEPRWPSEPFFLEHTGEGWTLGPFTPDRKDWATEDDGAKLWADGYTHPIRLRVRGQDDDILHANDGPDECDFRIVPVSQAPPQWVGQP